MDPIISPMLLTYFLHHFQTFGKAPERKPPPPPRVYRQIRGSLTVDTTEVSGGFARGQQRVEMLRIGLQADCSQDVTVESIAAYRRGLGLNQDLTGVYLMEGENRVTRVRTLSNSDGKAQLRFREPFVVSACSKRQLVLMVDISPNASIAGQHQFFIRSAKDIVASKTDVTLQRQRSVSRPRTTAGPSSGAIEVSYPEMTNRIFPRRRQIVGRIAFTAHTNKSQYIHSVLLTNKGTARSADIWNIYLETGGERVTGVKSRLDAKRVLLKFEPPLFLRKGQTRSLVMRAHVRNGRGRKVQFIVEEPADLVASEANDRTE